MSVGRNTTINDINTASKIISDKIKVLKNLWELKLPKIIFKYKDKEVIIDEKNNDLTILEIAQKNGIDIEGSCEGSLACSTCHIIVDKEWYSMLDKPSWDEEDMLDLATGLTLTSRLGCQITVTDKLDGLKISLPFVQNDIRLNNKKY